jgi:hypothetical protein
MTDRDSSAELRSEHFDGSDPFMTHGHQIIVPRIGKKRSVPDWVNDRIRIQQILLTSFPKMMTDSKQRERAGRWARILYLHYQANSSYSQIADEMGLTANHVRMILVGIRRVANGRRYDGRGERGVRPRGRPRKTHVPTVEIHVPNETSLGLHLEEGS